MKRIEFVLSKSSFSGMQKVVYRRKWSVVLLLQWGSTRRNWLSLQPRKTFQWYVCTRLLGLSTFCTGIFRKQWRSPPVKTNFPLDCTQNRKEDSTISQCPPSPASPQLPDSMTANPKAHFQEWQTQTAGCISVSLLEASYKQRQGWESATIMCCQKNILRFKRPAWLVKGRYCPSI